MAVTQGHKITVVGAGILGIWQALTLARHGHAVELIDQSRIPFSKAASRYAGAMIAPNCEGEAAPDVVVARGLQASQTWRQILPGLQCLGSLVVAGARDQSELRRFESATAGHQRLVGRDISDLEPELADRFQSALFFPDEAHMTTPDAMHELLSLFGAAGGQATFGTSWDRESSPNRADWLIDCRGLGARHELPNLRGVRGERVLVRAPDVRISRPVRMLHPRYPIYVVPWTDDRYLIGATVIESEDTSAMTVRSALELLGLAYALHPGLGEAEIVELSAGIRPTLPDNVPAIEIDPECRLVRVNGAYRHGFLLAPELAKAVLAYLNNGATDDDFVTVVPIPSSRQ